MKLTNEIIEYVSNNEPLSDVAYYLAANSEGGKIDNTIIEQAKSIVMKVLAGESTAVEDSIFNQAVVSKIKKPEVEPTIQVQDQDVVPDFEGEVNTSPEDQMNNMNGAEFDPSNPARMRLQQFKVNPMFKDIVHRVDEPAKAPVPVAKEQPADLDIPSFKGFVKPPEIKEVPAPISHKLENPEPVTMTIKNCFDNSIMVERFPKIPLKEIEEIGNQNGHSVLFEEYPHIGIISVTVTNPDGTTVAVPKCFTIDTGMIIDRRVKLIGCAPKFDNRSMMEFAPMYELFGVNTKDHNRKVLDTKMINDIFTAGLMNVSKKEMYSDSYKALNRKVALISLPTKGLNKEERNALQQYVVKMNESGYFDKAIEMAPGSRFIFVEKELDKAHLSNFTLINEGVPMFYGTKANTVSPIIIESRDGNITIKSNGNTGGEVPPVQYHNHCNCGHC